MRGLNVIIRVLVVCGLLFAAPIAQTSRKGTKARPVWLGWGGPRGDFTSEAKSAYAN